MPKRSLRPRCAGHHQRQRPGRRGSAIRSCWRRFHILKTAQQIDRPLGPMSPMDWSAAGPCVMSVANSSSDLPASAGMQALSMGDRGFRNCSTLWPSTAYRNRLPCHGAASTAMASTATSSSKKSRAASEGCCRPGRWRDACWHQPLKAPEPQHGHSRRPMPHQHKPPCGRCRSIALQ